LTSNIKKHYPKHPKERKKMNRALFGIIIVSSIVAVHCSPRLGWRQVDGRASESFSERASPGVKQINDEFERGTMDTGNSRLARSLQMDWSIDRYNEEKKDPNACINRSGWGDSDCQIQASEGHCVKQWYQQYCARACGVCVD
jgi:hypothetical protein